MQRSFWLRLWNTNPLRIIGAIIVLQLLFFWGGTFSAAPGITLALVMVLAYVQNTTYSLQSRSANRNSNAYHLLAAVAANFAFFWSLRLLVKSDLPTALLAPYVFATILGTLHGNTISIKIESALGLSPEGAKGRPQLLKLWPTVAVLLALLTSQIYSLNGYTVLLPGKEQTTLTLNAWVLVSIMALTIFGNFTFAILRVARSADSYWFHFFAVVLNLGADFAKLAILVKFKMDWAMFLPTTTGSVIGSLIGANLAQKMAERIKARFDIHVFTKSEEAEREKTGSISWPKIQLVLLGVLLVPQTVFFGVNPWIGYAGGAVLLFFSAWQALSFTLKSRAGQRNNQQYLAWASVFSNGVWFLTMHQLVIGSITPEKAIPYIVGSAAGSLIGQLLSLRIERATGALMDASAVKPT
ncbi:MAG: hypothetical protein LiPW15_249 [Parcubacteria group bacterium LiPW_15]|nr:MAG: hypothetical protein LiPW15_249 [Parcubacteria group bacterium LiPW_15]